jgi:hypothetical protein
MWGKSALLAIGLLGQATALASPVLLICRTSPLLGANAAASYQVMFDEQTGTLSLDGREMKSELSISSTLITWQEYPGNNWHIDRTDGSWIHRFYNQTSVETIEGGFCKAAPTKHKF